MAERSAGAGSRFGFLITAAIGLAAVFAWYDLGLEPGKLGSSGGRLLDFLQRMVPPDPGVLGVVSEAALETVEIALVGTALSVVASIPLGLLAAGTVTPPWVHLTVKWLLAGIRGIPLILVAMIMVGAVGLGPLPGVLAISFHSTGMLAKFFAEAFESVDNRPLAALSSAGASAFQIHWFGTLPQIAPGPVARRHVPLRTEPARKPGARPGRRRRHRLLHPDLYPLFPVPEGGNPDDRHPDYGHRHRGDHLRAQATAAVTRAEIASNSLRRRSRKVRSRFETGRSAGVSR